MQSYYTFPTGFGGNGYGQLGYGDTGNRGGTHVYRTKSSFALTELWKKSAIYFADSPNEMGNGLPLVDLVRVFLLHFSPLSNEKCFY